MTEVTYQQIKEANEAIRTTDIKGKEYAEVNQRIKAFRMVYPTGTILTEMVSNENGVCVFRCTVMDGDRILGTGTAYEKEGSTFINKTSYIENAETSAVGRALGMVGFGIDTSVASAEEVQNAQLNQQTEKAEAKATETQINIIRNIYNEENIAKMVEYYKVNDLSELTVQQASQAIARKRGKK